MEKEKKNNNNNDGTSAEEKKPKSFLKKNAEPEVEQAEGKTTETSVDGKSMTKVSLSFKRKKSKKVVKIVRVNADNEHKASGDERSQKEPSDKQAHAGDSTQAKQPQGEKAKSDSSTKGTAPSAQKNKGDYDSIFQQRPNVKAGNLAGYGNKQHRFGQGSGNRDANKNKEGGQKNAGRFTGFEARAYADTSSGNKGNAGKKNNIAASRPQTSTGTGFTARYPIGQKTGVPMPVDSGKSAKKPQVRGRKGYDKKEHADIEEKTFQRKKRVAEMLSAVPSVIEMLDTISVSDLAKKMNLKASTLIAKLMEMGMMVTMNQSIDYDTAAILASEYNCDIKHVSLYDETVIKTESDEGAVLLSRPPVVTIMGHVDHGKTKTLDAIRNSNVVAGEFGDITQHIGAYMVNTPGGSITFLDTPGHEAFTMMRARGAALTDIVVLVVAADDGVMPQTVEAINHAKDANVPIIVAINKIDKPEANPEKVMTRLSELGLMPESWGGDTMYVEISALKGEGIDKLLETILLQAEVLELKTNYESRAEGKVVESRIDHGRGIVATILIQRGTLHTGDSYVAGIYSGKVRAIFNDKGETITQATASMPVEILGLEGMPNAGDPFQVAGSEKEARQISEKRQELKKFEASQHVKKVTLDNLYDTISEGEVQELKVIVKGDVQGSVEAVKQSLEKLSTKEIRLHVIHASAGAINESDVMLAAADSNAIIIGFNVRPTPQAKLIAEQEKIDIRKYNIIYEAVEEMKLAMEGMLSPDIKEKVIGMAEVREVFKVHKIGRIAGLYVTEGVIKRSCLVHVIRDGIVIFSGKLSSLKRFKDDAREVAAGYECGASLENYNDVEVGDQFEIIEQVEVARKLNFGDSNNEKPTSNAE
ncbi:MAG: translation initiation factor IF-2 [Spirochaetaceae bacterium]|nr:translation initiation factor IF-2 [Spirochaetaceae bacterium]